MPLTSAALLAEVTQNPAALSATVNGAPMALPDAFAAAHDAEVAAALNAPLPTKRNLFVAWADIFRYLDYTTCPAGAFAGMPVRYVVANYANIVAAAGGVVNQQVAVACWMGVENWRTPAYPDVDVHNAAFQGFCTTLLGAAIIAQADMDHFVHQLGEVDQSRAEVLWGVGTLIETTDVMAAHPRVKPPAPTDAHALEAYIAEWGPQ